jgi:uncharacterized protein (TIRG00374 family)
MKRSLIFSLKLVVSAVLLGYLVVSADVAAMLTLLGRVSGWYLAGILALMASGVWISCHKWKALLVAAGIICPMSFLCSSYLTGIYFNNFLPTSVGGDAIRVVQLARHYSPRMTALASVMTERFTGLLAMVFLSVVGACWSSLPVATVLCPWLALLCLSAILVIVATRYSACTSLLKALPLLGAKLELFIQGVHEFFNRGETIWTVIWTSLLYQLFMVLIYLLAASALSLELGFADLLLIVPVVTLLTLIPVSLNGLGVREGGFVYFLALAGIASEEALTFSLMVFLLGQVFSVAGALCFISSKER